MLNMRRSSRCFASEEGSVLFWNTLTLHYPSKELEFAPTEEFIHARGQHLAASRLVAHLDSIRAMLRWAGNDTPSVL